MAPSDSDDGKADKTFEPVFMSPGGTFVRPSMPALNLTPDASLAVFHEAFPVNNNSSPNKSALEGGAGADLNLKSTSILPPGVTLPSDMEGQSWGVKRGDVQDLGLFGGAILMTLPSRLEDVSGVRQVPDHQEVFVDKATDISLIIEILNHADDVSDDDAAKYHFEDLAHCNGAASAEVTSTALSGTNDTFFSELPSSIVKCVLVGRQQVSKFRDGNHNGMDEVLLFLAVVRMPEIGTDLLVSLNVPSASASARGSHGDSVSAAHAQKSVHAAKANVSADMFLQDTSVEVGEPGSDVSFAVDTMRLVSSSFKIVNYALFA